MLNYIWAFMIIIGVLFAAFTGNLKAVTDAALQSAQDAVTLCITMAGIMAFWMGLMKIAESAGIILKLTKLIQPFLTFLFPDIPKEHEARKYIATNCIANILGLGWAATPAGLKAMEELAKLNEERDFTRGRGKCKILNTKNFTLAPSPCKIASKEMCTFLIINVSSLQLIPVNIIAYRSQYGSVNPTAVIGPGLLATLFSTFIAVLFCKIMMKVAPNKH